MDDDGLAIPRLRPAQLIAVDAAVAALYTLVTALTAVAWVELPTGLVVGWVALVGLPVAVRRVWPRPVFAVVLCASALGLVVGVVGDPLLAAAYALYPLAVATPRRRREPTLALGVLSGMLLLVGSVIGTERPFPAGVVVTSGATLGLAWTLGRATRERRRARAREMTDLAERAVVEERLRIARDLHDVVSHTLSLIGVKAAIANHVADSRPDEVRDALRVIEATSRDALVEMRRMLGVLRTDDTDLSPAPGLADLPDLVAVAASAGVQVDLVERAPGRLPAGVELTVYRIVQESLTNVIRHAAPAHCRVTVTGGDGDVTIDVVDDGPGVRPDSGPGHGLHGIRERAQLHGGTCTAGPRNGGGFAVTVVLPVNGREDAA
ncbi:sensor histidine kinase [Virgisporangium aliadipatigenens]|uniref:sensor histidine kinase n=1 Tax=Virgisporangium aliadipatigenens TaxID=741659 RepID=UPI001942E473|nr:sensor histidine kinase [Virgisporangium aliadipatigenens]